MNLQDYGWLTDENIHPKLVLWLKNEGLDVFDIKEQRLEGIDDKTVLDLANEAQRIILTQDSDFGKMIYQQDVSFTGIFYLRPGHFSEKFHIQTIQEVFKQKLDVISPFILVAENKIQEIKIRLRLF